MLPSKLQNGEVFKTSVVRKINQIIDYLKTQRISGDNKTLKITQNASGLSLQAMPQVSAPKGGNTVTEVSQDVYFAKIISRYEANQYLVQLYLKGLNNQPEGAYRLYVPEMALGAALPNGTIVLAHKVLLNLTGGSD